MHLEHLATPESRKDHVVVQNQGHRTQLTGDGLYQPKLNYMSTEKNKTALNCATSAVLKCMRF